MTGLQQLRAEKDQFFASHRQSPLLPDQKQTFTGLNYFEENPALRVVVASLPAELASSRRAARTPGPCADRRRRGTR